MLGVMGNSAIFAQQAGRGGRKIPEISFTSTSDDPFIQSLSCNGQIIIESIKDGAPVVNKYHNLDKVMVEIEADSGTIVSIRGYVTELLFSVYNDDPDIDDWEGCFDIATINTSDNAILKKLSIALCESIEELDLAANTQLQYLYCNSCTGLTSLDLAANTQLQYLDCNSCTGLTSLDLAANTQLQYLDCGNLPELTSLDLAANTQLQTLYCGNLPELTSLDLAANTQLQYLDCNSCTGLTSISYSATNSNVSTSVANAITNASSSDGTVYTDSSGDYYNTIETAATAKGWTVEQIA